MSIEKDIYDNAKAIESVIDFLTVALGDRKFPARALPIGAFGLADDGTVLRGRDGFLDRYKFSDGRWGDDWGRYDDDVMVRLVSSDYMRKAP